MSAAAAAVFTLGFSLLGAAAARSMKQRIKRVALEREKMRAEEMARLRGRAGQEDQRAHHPPRGRAANMSSNVVDRFSLQKAFADENTVDALARAGYRGQGPLNTYVFLRFVTPFALFVRGLRLSAASPSLPTSRSISTPSTRVFIGLVGAYLPTLMLKNRTIKRQQSIKRAWPDALDLMLLCVEAGMSVEHAFKRVAKEIGMQSAELAEEITLTTAELSFLEDRTRAYDNLGKRTGLDVVKSVMTSLIQADRYGTSVGTSLRVMAEEGRETRMMDAEKKAAALPPKLTVPLIVFFLPVLFIVIISPAMIKIGADRRLQLHAAANRRCHFVDRDSGAVIPACAGMTARTVRLVGALDQVPAVLLGEQGPDIGHVGLDLVGRQFAREHLPRIRRTGPAGRSPAPGSAGSGVVAPRMASGLAQMRFGLAEIIGHGKGEPDIGLDARLRPAPTSSACA